MKADCEPDYKSFMNVMRRSHEFVKLNEDDQVNLAFRLNESPRHLRDWIDEVVSNYQKENIEIDGKLLFKQVKAVWWPDVMLEELK